MKLSSNFSIIRGASMSKTSDTHHTDPTVLRKTVIASRGAVNPSACKLIQNLPLHPMEMVALSVNKRYPRERQTRSYACSGESLGKDTTASINAPCETYVSDNKQIEAICRSGDFVRVLVDMADSDDVVMTALFEESIDPQCRHQVARDASAVLSRTRKPVLVTAGEHSARAKGNLLVAVREGTKRTRLTEYHIDISDMAGIEVVVLSVASPFWPVFSKMAVGMRSGQGKVVREIHDTQIQDATDDAMFLSDTLRARGAKSWGIGKVGKFVSETRNTAESCDCALICIPVNDTDMAHVRRIRSLLVELLGCTRIPILMLPQKAGVC